MSAAQSLGRVKLLNGTMDRQQKASSAPGPDSDGGQDPVKANDLDRQRENRVVAASNLSQIDRSIWESDNAGLEDEFSALEASLSTYLEMQRRMFRKLGGDEANSTNTESASLEDAHNRGLLISDAVNYIQHLEGIQRQLFDEKIALEDQVNGHLKKGAWRSSKSI